MRRLFCVIASVLFLQPISGAEFDVIHNVDVDGSRFVDVMPLRNLSVGLGRNLSLGSAILHGYVGVASDASFALPASARLYLMSSKLGKSSFLAEAANVSFGDGVSVSLYQAFVHAQDGRMSLSFAQLFPGSSLHCLHASCLMETGSSIVLGSGSTLMAGGYSIVDGRPPAALNIRSLASIQTEDMSELRVEGSLDTGQNGRLKLAAFARLAIEPGASLKATEFLDLSLGSGAQLSLGAGGSLLFETNFVLSTGSRVSLILDGSIKGCGDTRTGKILAETASELLMRSHSLITINHDGGILVSRRGSLVLESSAGLLASSQLTIGPGASLVVAEKAFCQFYQPFELAAGKSLELTLGYIDSSNGIVCLQNFLPYHACQK